MNAELAESLKNSLKTFNSAFPDEPAESAPCPKWNQVIVSQISCLPKIVYLCEAWCAIALINKGHPQLSVDLAYPELSSAIVFVIRAGCDSVAFNGWNLIQKIVCLLLYFVSDFCHISFYLKIGVQSYSK